jgi:MFS family permease
MPVAGGVLLTIVGTLLPWLYPSLAAIFASAAVTGAGFIFVQVGMQTLTGALGAGATRTRNINSYALTVSLADFIGPVLAGFSIDHTGHVATYLWSALVSSVSLVGIVVLAKRFPQPGATAAPARTRAAADLFRMPELRRVFVASGVVMTGVDLFQLYMPLYGHDIGLSASAIGLVLGSFAAAGFVTRALMPLVVARLGEERTLVSSLVAAAATFILIPFVHSGYALAAICFVLGLGMGMGQPLSILLAYNYSPPGRAGETIGMRIAINNSMHVVVPTAFGGLGSLIGLGPVFWVSSAVLGLGALIAGRRST